MIPAGVHTMAHAMLVGQRGSGSNLRSLPPHWRPPLYWCHSSSHDFGGSATDQLTFNIGYTGDG